MRWVEMLLECEMNGIKKLDATEAKFYSLKGG